MAIDEKKRHQLHTCLRTVLGEDEAATLMELVPKTDWDKIATKDDLEKLKHELIGLFRKEMGTATSSFVRATIIGNSVSVATVAGIAFAAAKLA